MDSNTIVITRPKRQSDPTEWTYQWAEDAIKMMKGYGYNVIDIKRTEVTYENVSKAMKQYNPRLYIHVGHGCPSSLQGQTECIVTRKFGVDELVAMPNFREIIQPLLYAAGCINTCKTMPDICNPLCTYDTNIGLFKGTIIYTISCFSASQLGKCAIKYGVDAYIGYNNLMLFPVDDMGSQEIFKDVHLLFLKELLEGKTVAEAEKAMNQYEDSMIKLYKGTKYVSLPLLWNKIQADDNGTIGPNRVVLGNKDATIRGI